MACIMIPTPYFVQPRPVGVCTVRRYNPHRRRVQVRRPDSLLSALLGINDSYHSYGGWDELPLHLLQASLLRHILANCDKEGTNEKEGEKSSAAAECDPTSGCKSNCPGACGCGCPENSTSPTESKEKTTCDSSCPGACGCGCPEQAESEVSEQGTETTDLSETPENFSLVLRVGSLKPENLKVSVKSGYLVVSGKYSREVHLGLGMYSTEERHIRRSFPLPDNVNVEELTSKLDENGLLKFEAPLLAVETPKERTIPITTAKPVESENAAGSSEETTELRKTEGTTEAVETTETVEPTSDVTTEDVETTETVEPTTVSADDEKTEIKEQTETVEVTPESTEIIQEKSDNAESTEEGDTPEDSAEGHEEHADN
ncbi:uncharacterized protein LOC144446097 [Glandiceps talaboti]